MTPAPRVVRFRAPHRAPRSTNGILFPLDLAYQRAGVAVPAARRIAPSRIPPPYDMLLAHEREMTSTLERHFDTTLVVRVLSAWTRGRWYYRRSLLAQELSGRPVAMGMVRLNMYAFSARVCAQIVRGETPLGRILHNAGLRYHSRPRTFLEITPTSEMMGVFWMRECRTLYGRQTDVTLTGERIGNIIEVLPLV
jgi:hypothetical protein